MAGPWEKYAQPSMQDGPWAKYGKTPDAGSANSETRLGLLSSIGAGAGARFGNTVLAGQKLVGQGIKAVDEAVNGRGVATLVTGKPTSTMGRAGQWLVDDAEMGQARLSAENKPYADANPLSNSAGALASDLIVTAPVGGALAKVARYAAPGVAATKTGANIIRAVETSGAQGGNLLTRAIGGGITGGASTALIDPEHAGQGALIGAVAPSALTLIGKAGSAAGRALRPGEANPQTLAAAREAQKAGYVIPPSDIQPQGIFTETLGGLSGKIKTAQVASAKNQAVTNNMARKELGIPADAPITTDALDAIRAKAGEAYGAVSSLGKIPARASELPSSVNVVSGTDKLTMAPKSEVDAAELVRAWKQSNADATAWYRAYSRDANPETLAKAKAAANDSKQIDTFLQDKLKGMGQSDLLDALKAARVQIAKSYTVEKALNGSTGDVSASTLANDLAKGKALSGDLLEAAKAGQAFPKATQALKEAPKAISPLDIFASGALGAATSNPLALASLAARPAARGAILSKPMQRYASRDVKPNALSALIDPTGKRITYRAAPLLAGDR